MKIYWIIGGLLLLLIIACTVRNPFSAEFTATEDGKETSLEEKTFEQWQQEKELEKLTEELNELKRKAEAQPKLQNGNKLSSEHPSNLQDNEINAFMGMQIFTCKGDDRFFEEMEMPGEITGVFNDIKDAETTILNDEGDLLFTIHVRHNQINCRN